MILGVGTLSCIHVKNDRPFLEKGSDMGQFARNGRLHRGRQDSVSAPRLGRLDEQQFTGVARGGAVFR